MFNGILSSPSELQQLMDRCFLCPSNTSLSTTTGSLYPGHSGTARLPQRPGFSAGSAEIGAYVKQTTDFQAIFNVIDYLNSSTPRNNANQNILVTAKKGNKNKAMDEAVKYLKRKWKENPRDAIFILRTLTLLECCNKNCNPEWSNYVGTQDFMQFLMVFATISSNRDLNVLQDEINNTTRGEGNYNNNTNSGGQNIFEEVNIVSKRMIFDWANNFQNNPSYPVFYDTYLRLKMKGVLFLGVNDDETKDKGDELEDEDEHQNTSTTNQEKTENDRHKLKKDLETVSEQITLCQEMLKNILLDSSTTGIGKERIDKNLNNDNNFGEEEEEDTLIEIVAFLEACKPRMDDIIEAGMEDVNIITEPILELALEVNVELLATLEVERSRDKAELWKLVDDKEQKTGGMQKKEAESENDLISLTYENQEKATLLDDRSTTEKGQGDGLQIKDKEDIIDLHE